MLNAALQTIRRDKNTCLLMTNGLLNFWHSPERWEKDILTQINTGCVYSTQYRAYFNNEANCDLSAIWQKHLIKGYII